MRNKEVVNKILCELGNFPPYFLEKVEKTESKRLVRKIQDLIDKFPIEKKWLLISGKTGIGKTHTVVYLAYQLVVRKLVSSVFFLPARKCRQLLDVALEKRLIILDDVDEDSDGKVIKGLICDCYDLNKILYITTNLPFPTFTQQVGGDKVIRRIRERGVILCLTSS